MYNPVQAMFALQALKGVVPGFEQAKLRNFGMTIGTRDSRKIIGRTNLTGEHVRNQVGLARSNLTAQTENKEN